MNTKALDAIAPLIAQLQARDAQLCQSVIEFAGGKLPGESANKLISIVRNSQSAIDVKAELSAIAATLMQPN